MTLIQISKTEWIVEEELNYLKVKGIYPPHSICFNMKNGDQILGKTFKSLENLNEWISKCLNVGD